MPGAVTGTDGSFAPIVSQIKRGVTTALGLTWQSSAGLSLGAGVTYQFGLEDDSATTALTGESGSGHAWGMQFRLGFHNGVRMFVAPTPPQLAEAAPPPATPPPPPAPAKPAPPPAPAPAAAPAPRPAEPTAAVVKTLNFEEVHFDFDQDNLRPDAIAVLDRVVDGLKQNPGARLRIEGHASAEVRRSTTCHSVSGVLIASRSTS